MKYLFVLSLFFIPDKNGFCQVKTGDKYGAVVRLTIAAAKTNVNHKWNNDDHTGNTAVDGILDKYANASKTNAKAITALENIAADIRSDPEKFIDPDGTINKDAFNVLLTSKFAAAGNVTVPSNAFADSNTNRSMRNE